MSGFKGGVLAAASAVQELHEEGAVVVEYGVLLVTIILLIAAVGPTVVGGVQAFFAGLPAGLP